MAYRPPHRQSNNRKQPAEQKQTSTSRRQRKQPEHKQNLDWLPSVSRSGGLDGDGDSLKDHQVQERYRAWIDEKLLECEKKGDNGLTEKDILAREDIVRRFRKLREGILASNRNDEFSIEVYETSLVIASAYKITEQVTSVAAQILPMPVLEVPRFLERTHNRIVSNLPSTIALFHILLHHLVLSAKSPLSLRWVIGAISHPTVATKLGPRRTHWLKQLRLYLKHHNYQAIWKYTAKKTVGDLVTDALGPGQKGARQSAAIMAELEALRDHVRSDAWKVVRSAYREESETWLCTSLALPSEPAKWLGEKQKLQEALLVPNERPRWKVFKPKPPP